MKNNNVIKYYLLIGLAIFIPIIIGFSSAYFFTNIYGNPSNVGGNVSTVFDIKLVTKNNVYINVTDLQLIEASEIDELSEKAYFNVETGNNEHPINYTLSLTDLAISENLQTSDFKWQLICENDINKNITGTFNGINTNTMIITTNNLILANSEDRYEFRIWLEENDTNQSNLLNGTFSAKFSIVSRMVY